MVRRQLGNFLIGTTLLLSLAAAGMWVRSRGVEDYVGYHLSGGGRFALNSRDGRLGVWTDSYNRPRESGWEFHSEPLAEAVAGRWPEYESWANVIGFGGFAVTCGGSRGRFYAAVALPWWFVAMLAGGVAATGIRGRWKARRRTRLGMCPRCGYDLRATPGRCPECGAKARPPGDAVA